MESQKIKLQKPIKGNDGNEVTELVFDKELTAADVAKCGFPFSIDSAKGRQELKADVCLKYAAILTGINEALLGKMGVADLMSVTAVVMDFFGGAAAE